MCLQMNTFYCVYSLAQRVFTIINPTTDSEQVNEVDYSILEVKHTQVCAECFADLRSVNIPVGWWHVNG